MRAGDRSHPRRSADRRHPRPRPWRRRYAATLISLLMAFVGAAAAAGQQSDTTGAGQGRQTVQRPAGQTNGAGSQAGAKTVGPRGASPRSGGVGKDRNTVGASGPSTLVYPPYNHTYGIHKARTPHLKLFLGGRTVFSDPQGLAAVKLAQDDDPKQKADDFQLTVLGLNAGRGEIIYNSSMQTLAMYGTHGSKEGQFDAPRGIAADVQGNIYVADTGNRRVVHLLWRNRQLVWLDTLEGSYLEPWGVATAPPGREVYVSDRRGNQIYRWTPMGSDSAGSGGSAPGRGEAPRDTGGNGRRDGGGGRGSSGHGQLVGLFPEGISRPTAVAVIDHHDEWLTPKEDALYVIYEDGARLAKFDHDGKPLGATSASERDSVRAAPRFAYLACDFYGNVYVTDTGNSTIYKFKRDLTYLTSYGEYGEGEFELVEPRGIAIWKRFGQVLVAEKEGAQYFFVGTDLVLPEGPLAVRITGSGGEKRYAFDASFTEPTDLAIEFLAADGSRVDSLAVSRTLESGRVTISLAASEVIPDLERRASRIVLEPKPTYSSRKRFDRRLERPIEWIESH